MRWALLFCALLVVSAAGAEDGAPGPTRHPELAEADRRSTAEWAHAAISACLAEQADPRKCDRVALRGCLEIGVNTSTAGQRRCALAAAAAWERVAAARFAELYASYAFRADADAAPFDDIRARMSKAQRAWEAYREAQCGLMTGEEWDGSGAKVLLAECRREMAYRRAYDLLAAGNPYEWWLRL